MDDEEEALSSTPSDTYMLGFVIANIVGLQYYSGTISGREMVGLVREPLNPYDSNAIRVFNTRSLQVGHIERAVAAALAPLIDAQLIAVEGIVPNTRSKSNRFKIPCQVHVFARIEDFPAVNSTVVAAGLQLISNSDAGFTLSEAVVVKEKKAESGFKSVDEIFKLVEENAKQNGALEAMEAPQELIKSELFPHQKKGLGWLFHRENSNDLPPFWEEKKDGSFVNVLTNYRTDQRPEPLRGGIFADDMGLGKTLTLLSLIAFDKYCSGENASENESLQIDNVTGEDEERSYVSGSRKGKETITSKKGNANARKRRKTEEENASVDDKSTAGLVSKSTMIVCPPSVFSNWVTQLEEHTRAGRLKVYIYYGGQRTRSAEELMKYDIVLTTYSILATEHSSTSCSPVQKIEWWRVILDEAHTIKNVNAQQSQAVTNLKAKRRWAVTGTPIQNGSFDLFSLLSFLRFEPFSIKSYWQSLVQRPLAQGNKMGLSRLQVLMATISLRRTKDKALIGLPPKTIETCYVELSAEERELYDMMELEAKTVFKSYIDAGTVMRKYSTILSIILLLRQICTDLALCPDLKSVLPSNSIEDVSNPELLRKMVELLQDGEDFDCPICISPPTNVVITCCAHIFCQSCIMKTIQRKPCCPLCRRPLSQSDLFSAPRSSSDNDNDKSPRKVMSSKVSTLIKLLNESRNQNPLIKSVVFSQFRNMLLYLEEELQTAGYKVLRLDGTMTADKRSQVIKKFGLVGNDAPTILLASLKASGTGINLTAASRVYMLEPWWNPAVEEQAMDRVHRIGQKEDVKIVRLIARNSIEERILELQEKKKKLAKEAFGKRSAKDRKNMDTHDLISLMSL